MIRHRAVADAVRDAIFLADIETGMIVDANPAAEVCVAGAWRSFGHFITPNSIPRKRWSVLETRSTSTPGPQGSRRDMSCIR